MSWDLPMGYKHNFCTSDSDQLGYYPWQIQMKSGFEYWKMWGVVSSMETKPLVWLQLGRKIWDKKDRLAKVILGKSVKSESQALWPQKRHGHSLRLNTPKLGQAHLCYDSSDWPGNSAPVVMYQFMFPAFRKPSAIKVRGGNFGHMNLWMKSTSVWSFFHKWWQILTYIMAQVDDMS